MNKTLTKKLGIGLVSISGLLSILATNGSTTRDPEIERFAADPERVCPGSTVSLVWETSNVDTISIDPGSFTSSEASGRRPVSVSRDTNYVLTARSGTSSPPETASAQVEVLPPDGRERIGAFGSCEGDSPVWTAERSRSEWHTAQVTSLTNSSNADLTVEQATLSPSPIRLGRFGGSSSASGSVAGTWKLTPDPIPVLATQYCACLAAPVRVVGPNCGSPPLGSYVIEVDFAC